MKTTTSLTSLTLLLALTSTSFAAPTGRLISYTPHLGEGRCAVDPRDRERERAESKAQLEETDARRKRALWLGCAASVAAVVVAWGAYAALKSIPDKTAPVHILLLLMNAVAIGAPFVGVIVYRSHR